MLDVIRLFGYLSETNYGEYFEIRSEKSPVNLAYTKRGLQCHTDNPYRHPVPELQLFSCLRNDTQGGESIVVDGFNIAQQLKNESEYYFQLLCSYDASFHYQDGTNTNLKNSCPMIQLSTKGNICRIHFNNRSCDALTQIPFEKIEDYYAAYRCFSELVNNHKNQVVFKLNPGELFITDNTRVLHGRTAFNQAGKRWMQGAYADKDSMHSTIRCLQ